MIAKIKNAFWGAHDFVVGGYFIVSYIVRRAIDERNRKLGR